MTRGLFDNLMETLEEISDGMTYYMEIPPDEDGYLDKECPSDRCLSKFKVQSDDWVERIQDHEAYCPFCGYKAGADEWRTTEQIEQAKDQAVDYASALIDKALSKDSERGGFLFEGNNHYYDLPAETLDLMQQKITCEECGFRYAVIGSSFFCPCCGRNTATRTYRAQIDRIKGSVENLDAIRGAVTDKDNAERICETILIGAVTDLVATVQRVCESVYEELGPEVKPRQNAFQNLDEGNKLWEELTGEGYHDWLSEDQYKTLAICFQRRHVFDHQVGLADDKYIERSGDDAYEAGQRIILRQDELLRYIEVVETLCEKVLEQRRINK